MAEVLVGLGANLGDPVRTIGEALDRLDRHGARVVARSAFYRTPPWGVTDQPDFVNLCARLDTALPPRALLNVTQAIEAELGRVRDRRWGPRAIDIDLLIYDCLVLDEPGLTLPHPRLTERAFVLIPLAEIASDLMLGRESVGARAARCDRAGILRLGFGSPAVSLPDT